MLFEQWMFKTTNYESKQFEAPSAVSLFTYIHTMLFLKLQYAMVQHTTIFTGNMLYEYYQFRTCYRQSTLFVVFIPAIISQYETSTVSTLHAVRE
jgi:hypothetical protein